MRLLFCILIVSTWLPCCHAARPTVPDRQRQEECLSQFASDEIESAIEAEGEGEEDEGEEAEGQDLPEPHPRAKLDGQVSASDEEGVTPHRRDLPCRQARSRPPSLPPW